MAERYAAAHLRVDRLREDSGALELIHEANVPKGTADLYRERLRPRFHFTSRRGWNNNPNGLVYDQGEYHLLVHELRPAG